MIVGEFQDGALVELLLCASDLARGGMSAPITHACIGLGVPIDDAIATEARYEAKAVAPMVFEYRNDLLADCLLEAAYRVAAGQGAGSATP